jgi:hypothetical protein
MAKLTGALQMTGSIGGLSIYRMKGCTELVVRTKGGFNKERIKNDGKLANVRSMNKEWIGVTQMAGAIRRSLIQLAPMSNFNYSGQLCALSKSIQKSSLTGFYGKRPILLSQCREQLSGFSFNINGYFNSVVRAPIRWKIDRLKRKANVEIDEMDPFISIADSASFPYFRFIIVLGVISDILYDEADDAYKSMDEANHEQSKCISTDWYMSNLPFLPLSIEIAAPDASVEAGNNCTFVLAMGIEYGLYSATGDPKVAIKRGFAQILGAL